MLKSDYLLHTHDIAIYPKKDDGKVVQRMIGYFKVNKNRSGL
jgi:hypothetical protein